MLGREGWPAAKPPYTMQVSMRALMASRNIGLLGEINHDHLISRKLHRLILNSDFLFVMQYQFTHKSLHDKFSVGFCEFLSKRSQAWFSSLLSSFEQYMPTRNL